MIWHDVSKINARILQVILNKINWRCAKFCQEGEQQMILQTMKKGLFVMAMVAGFLPMAWANEAPESLYQASVVDIEHNWHQVSPLLYRSEQPVAKNIVGFQEKGIKTIVNLRFFNRDEDTENLGNSGFNLINKPLLTWSIHPKEVASILHVIKAQQKEGAVLVHCYHGSDRTGLIIGMYRIVYENWPIEKAYDEMKNGPYRFSPFWTNITALFTDEKVAEIKAELTKLNEASIAH